MAFNYSPNEFIKVYRQLLEWEWYSDANTTKVFLHCLLRANWKPGKWKGVKYEAGQFITSLSKIAQENGLSFQQARTALEHLISTGEVTSKNIPQGRIITIKNWDKYQTPNKVDNKRSTSDQQGKQQASNKRVTTDIRSKEDKKFKEDKNPPKPPHEKKWFELTEEEKKAEYEKAKEEGWE